jgi:hypothetical protein
MPRLDLLYARTEVERRHDTAVQKRQGYQCYNIECYLWR